MGLFHFPWLTFCARVIAIGCIASMVGGCLTVLAWMILVSMFTPRLPQKHILRIWRDA